MSRIQKNRSGVTVRPKRNELIELKRAINGSLERNNIQAPSWRDEPMKKVSRRKNPNDN